jgi:hypothetical protein
MANAYTIVETVRSQAELFILWNMTRRFRFCRAADQEIIRYTVTNAVSVTCP